MNCNESSGFGQTPPLRGKIGWILFPLYLFINLITREMFFDTCDGRFVVLLPYVWPSEACLPAISYYVLFDSNELVDEALPGLTSRQVCLDLIPVLENPGSTKELKHHQLENPCSKTIS